MRVKVDGTPYEVVGLSRRPVYDGDGALLGYGSEVTLHKSVGRLGCVTVQWENGHQGPGIVDTADMRVLRTLPPMEVHYGTDC